MKILLQFLSILLTQYILLGETIALDVQEPANHLLRWRVSSSGIGYESLIKSKVNSDKLARKAAVKYLAQNEIILGEELSLKVSALRKGSFLVNSKWFWEVSLLTPNQRWSGVFFINADTAEVHAFIPLNTP